MNKAAPGNTILLIGDTLSCANLRHALPVKVPDPVLLFEGGDGRTVYANSLDVPLLEDIRDLTVVAFEELAPTTRWDPMDWFAYFSHITVLACRAEGIGSVIVPPDFPLTVASALEAAGINVIVDSDIFVQRRRVKKQGDIAGMRRAISAVEAAWDGIREDLRSQAQVTSEALQARAMREFAAFDVIPFDIIIVPHGGQAATGHHGGAGVIRPGEPVIVDLIAHDRETGMYADLTRTFCLGDPSAELGTYFELCQEALGAAIDAIAPGVTAAELDDVVSTLFESAGQPTERSLSPRDMDRGFYGGLGHGVGLELHEPPLVEHDADVPLLEGEVLCLEPALYRAGFGGCRLEDMVLVTANGAEKLSTYEYGLAA